MKLDWSKFCFELLQDIELLKKKMVEPSMFPLVSNPKFNAKNSHLYFKISL